MSLDTYYNRLNELFVEDGDNNNSKEAVFSKFNTADHPLFNDFIASVPETFSQFVGQIAKVGINHSISSDVLLNRAEAQKFIFQFHEEADTLTEEVRDTLHNLSLPTTLMAASAHQPNLFAYGGVFKKSLLLQMAKDFIAEHKLMPQKMVNLFVIVDHDFVDDIWIRKAQLPSIHTQLGLLELRFPVTGKDRRKLVCNTPLPSRSIVDDWKRQVKLWIKKSCLLLGCSEKYRNELLSRLDLFWSDVVEHAHTRARTYSDFNAFVISRVMNLIFGLDVLFVRLSDLLPLFYNGFEFLIRNYELYTSALKSADEIFGQFGVKSNVSPLAYQKAPMWLHCQCGSKASVDIRINANRMVALEGKCELCRKILWLPVGQKDSVRIPLEARKLLSPKAISLPILLTRELGMTCYASGLGGMNYILYVKMAFKAFCIDPPQIIFWPSKDVYPGLAQQTILNELNKGPKLFSSEMAEMLKLNEEYGLHVHVLIDKKHQLIKNNERIDEILKIIGSYKAQQRMIRKNIKSAQKAVNAINVPPCIIDYAVNFNMYDLPHQWNQNLIKNDALFSFSYLAPASMCQELQAVPTNFAGSTRARE